MWHASLFSANLDSSWEVIINHAFAEGMQFGKDIVFSYGPLGFITLPTSLPVYHSTNYPWYLAAVLLRSFALAGILAWALPHRFRWSISTLVWLIVFFGVAFHPRMQFFIYPPLLVVAYFALPEGRIRTGLLWGLAVWLAGMSLGKLSYFTLSAPVVLLLATHHIWQRRRVPGFAVIYITALLALWIAAGQDLSNLPAFLANATQIASGYGAAMGKPAPLLAVAYYWVLGLTVTVAVGLLTWQDRLRAAVLVTAFVFTLLVVFKAYFSRYEPARADHAIRFVVALSLLAWLPATAGAVQRQHWIASGALVLVLAAAFLFRPEFSTLGTLKTYALGLQITDMKTVYDRGIHGLINWPETLEKQRTDSARQRSQVAAKYAGLHPDGSTVDVYSIHAALAVSGGWIYRPRPVFQSYSAYTESLLRLNADHLRSDRAPETIIITWVSLDGHLTSLEDSLSWPELLTRYQASGLVKLKERRMLKLKKRQQPLEYVLEPVSIIEGKLGETVMLPETERLWVRLHLQRTPLERLAKVLRSGQLPHLFINGESRKYQLVPEIAEAGFLLSPLVRDTNEFAQLMSDPARLQAVRTLRVVADEDSFDEHFKIELFHLRIR